jgi:hypothetical protein
MTPSEAKLLGYLRQLKGHIQTIRNQYSDPDTIREEQELDTSGMYEPTNPEQYLKRVYQVTMGFALANGLYGRPEFLSDPVMSFFEKEKGMAFLWDPENITPLVDVIRREFISPVFSPMKPAQRLPFSQQALLTMQGKAKPALAYSNEDMDAIRYAFTHDQWETVERLAYPSLAQAALLLQFQMLVNSEKMGPFFGQEHLDASLFSCVFAHIIENDLVNQGTAGRALVHALAGYNMMSASGMLIGNCIQAPESFWNPVTSAQWSEQAGYAVGNFGKALGFKKRMTPRGKDYVPS